ncbi:MAG: S-methyl-5'-thioadenosine phosphorylase [Deltaproteobacteria bacterium]|nr:S-methyl-5'-thioadenosine phosphorylase [Deltaproteobacteria bacterium]
MIGIIGGTGLGESLGALGVGQRHTIDTPFGMPSGPITITEVSGVPVALLARHGDGHLLNPSSVPFRANIFALKSLGVTHIIASAAAGSLRDKIAPRDLVLPDQAIDKTFCRPTSFFDGVAVHVEMAAPFCPTLRGLLSDAGAGLPLRLHSSGTYVCMEGPQFSTRAESEMHRAWGADLVGMTLLPEAKLAREAEICYAAVVLVTDYDCWRKRPPGEDKVALLQEIIDNLKAATQNAMALIRDALPFVAAQAEVPCDCQSALRLAVWSDRNQIPDEVRQRVAPLLGKYLGR